jgi:hypothetical protein
LQWGYSLSNVRELLLPCLDARGATTVLEIGAYEGDLTADLLDWAAGSGAEIAGMDPLPPDRLRELKANRPELELIEETSHDYLAGLDSLPDAIVIDGDHNYFTLSEELRLIAEIGQRSGQGIPLLFFHDVLWPHQRRDTYYAPERIPEEHRPKEIGHNVGLAPGIPGTAEWGLPFVWAAVEEGGPGNGTMTAIEDFLAGQEGLRLVVVPAFFGFGIIFPVDAPWAPAVAAILDPFDRNPVLERMESNRVEHLVAGQARARELEALKKRSARQEAVLRKLADSSAFAIAEKLSGLRQRGEPSFSREEVRAALSDDGDGSS